MKWIMINIRRKTTIIKQLYGILVAMAALLIQGQVSGEACGQEELSNCAKPLQVLSSTSELSFVTKREDLDKLCPDLRIGVECIRSYTRRCMDINQRDHFNKLYEGTNEMVKDLCEDEKYKEDFLRHTPCMHMIKKSYEKCATKYQETMNRIAEENNNPTTTTTTTTTTTRSPWTSDLSNYVVLGRNTEVQQIRENTTNRTALSPEQEYIKQICCAFQEYMECSEMTVYGMCGHETAKFTRKFLDRMASQLIKMHCVNYDRHSGLCPSWEGSHASKLSSSYLYSLLIISIVSCFIVMC